MPTIITRGAASARGFGFAGRVLAQGTASYTTAGTFIFTAPANVFSVGVTATGGGGGGGSGFGFGFTSMCGCSSGSAKSGGGGGSGGKGVKSIVVSPGSNYTVVVGALGSGASCSAMLGGNGGQSYFCSASAVAGNGGTGGYRGGGGPGNHGCGGAGGGFVGTSGTNGNTGNQGNLNCNTGGTATGVSGGASVNSPYGAGGSTNNITSPVPPSAGTQQNNVGGNNGGSGAVVLVYNG